MRNRLAALMLCGMLCGPVFAQETQQPPPAAPAEKKAQPKKGRAALLTKLNDDVGTAMANASLEKKYTRRLDNSRETLREATDRNASKKPDQKTVRKAVNQINKVFQEKGDAFRAEDRAAVLDDLLRLQPTQKPAQRRVRPVRPRRPGMRIPQPYPRWPRL